jgi:hypothetical protein
MLIVLGIWGAYSRYRGSHRKTARCTFGKGMGGSGATLGHSVIRICGQHVFTCFLELVINSLKIIHIHTSINHPQIYRSMIHTSSIHHPQPCSSWPPSLFTSRSLFSNAEYDEEDKEADVVGTPERHWNHWSPAWLVMASCNMEMFVVLIILSHH